MDIISPKTLWRDYDRKELPLDTAVISDRSSGNVRELRVFFNGTPEVGACARVYARLVMPSDGKALPAAVLMRDAEYDIGGVDAAPFTDKGYALLVVDYAGRRVDTPFYTMYPESMSYANFTAGCLTKAPRDPRNNCWIVWAKLMLRAVTYLESLEEIDSSKIVAVGEGVASASVWKACVAEEKLCCGVSLFGSRFKPEYIEEDAGDEAEDRAYLGYEAALMKASYAPFVKVPLLVMASSNDRDDSIDNISEAYSLIPKNVGCRLSISERMHRAIGFKQSRNFWLWLDRYIKGEGVIPEEPALTASCSDHKLYYEVTADKKAEAELFVSQAIEHGSMRNWHSEKLIKTGEGVYISRTDVYDISKPVYAFVNIFKDGFSLSSPITEKLPAAMGVTATPVKPARLIYDSELGVDDWTVFSPTAAAQATMVKGPFDIDGVSAGSGALLTYKLADVIYSGDGSDILQVCMFSAAQQEVTLSIIIKEDEEGETQYYKYRATLMMSPEDNWRKINLVPSDFISESGACQGWDNIVSLKIDSGVPVVVKSVLWV